MDKHAIETLTALDAAHVWHPYASITPAFAPQWVVRAKGVYLELADGKQLIDGMSSWWCVIHGYQHPTLNAAIQTQLQMFAHVMFGGLTHEAAVQLAKQLADLTGLSRVFFSDSGSVAVEVAMKMALQYQYAKGQAHKTQFATFYGGYHGDTWHPMSVCDPVTGMHHLFQNKLAPQIFIKRPQARFDSQDRAQIEADKAAISQAFATHHANLAAVIVEPIVQGAGGMWFYHPEVLAHLKACAAAANVLFIADEIATGFGRTGRLFACEHAAISPDILCLGKALTGGYLSFAATLASDEVAKTISQAPPHVLMHGPTFMGNALAASVALASLALLEENDWAAAVKRIESHLKANLPRFLLLPIVKEVRVLGAIGVVETKVPLDLALITPLLLAEGVWLRPFGQLYYIMPAYVMDNATLDALVDGMFLALAHYPFHPSQ